ncbi:hypothetical protein Glove_276g91 [Diversispora epigaea]|uniref:Protein kinase domain-containing protein n=1 Tax=Diversispora epigaea TaxID=1348612 RepID=A0A397IAW4_9GLOM|nr:hypothetical protein Glove_276g91 [Diversispora epigaea]
MSYGICPECDQDYTNYSWCKPCNSTRFKNDFDKWTSGNDTIDKFIQDAQLNANRWDKVIEWIPYDRFKYIKELAKGGFGTIYYAEWFGVWDDKQQWKRSGQHEVVLKKFDGIGDINEDFLNEMSIHLRSADAFLSSINFYGITKDPETHEYMMVFEYLIGGNLRNYLNNNFNISWYKKLKYLRNLAVSFKEIHEVGIIHHDFHPGNVLLYNFNYASLRISDFGLSKLIGKNVRNPQKRNVFGVLPYIAPEVLGGEKYTKAAEVYSFAIVAYEIVTGFRPYPDVAHDDELALKICNGLRPKIPFHTPKLITKMIMRCWDARIIHQPTFKELYGELKKHQDDYEENTYFNSNEITTQFKEAEKFSKNHERSNTTPLNFKTHPQAIYTSRLLNFSNLPKPKNEPNFEKELEELMESFSYIITMNNKKMTSNKICPECNQVYTHNRWCKPCNATHFKNDFDKWTSESVTMNKFIQDAQLNADRASRVIEWIPYKRFKDIKQTAKGGFSTIYQARWIDGPIYIWNIENQQWKRSGQRDVALKKFDGIGDINEEFLNEMEVHLKTIDEIYSVEFYGITKDPGTRKYLMVLDYLKGGNLRNYLNNNFNNIEWSDKLKYLRDLAKSFTKIHKLDIIHQDFHPGNILSYNFNFYHLYISDFGLSKLIGKNGENSQTRNVFGVLPYIAPEVLCGGEYIKASDVYSFAIIACEIVTGLPPYPDVAHDDDLALKICNGLRPKIPFHTPELITQMIMRCWDARISCRPTFEEINKELHKYYNDYLNLIGVITIQIKEAEEFAKNKTTIDTDTTTTTLLNYKTHPQAIYTSRLLKFSNLPKPINEPNFEKKLEELTESFSHIITNDDIDDF